MYRVDVIKRVVIDSRKQKQVTTMKRMYHNILTDGKNIVADADLSAKCIKTAVDLTRYVSSAPFTIVADDDVCFMLHCRPDAVQRANAVAVHTNVTDNPPFLDRGGETFADDPLPAKDYASGRCGHVYRPSLNTAKNPLEYGAMGMACSYDWKTFHMAMDPDRSGIVNGITSAAILHGLDDIDGVKALAEYVYNFPCCSGGVCQGRNLRFLHDPGHYDRPLPALLPAIFYDLDLIGSSVADFVKFSLAPIAEIMKNSHGSAPNNVRMYLSDQESDIDPFYVSVRTTFECVLDCLCKKTAAVASDLFAIDVRINDDDGGGNGDDDEPVGVPRDLFMHPEQLRFEGFPPSVMQQTRDVRLVGPSIATVSLDLPVIHLIMVGHAIWSASDRRLVCDGTLEPKCARLQTWMSPERPNGSCR